MPRRGIGPDDFSASGSPGAESLTFEVLQRAVRLIRQQQHAQAEAWAQSRAMRAANLGPKLHETWYTRADGLLRVAEVYGPERK